jgi:hypothetical protein
MPSKLELRGGIGQDNFHVAETLELVGRGS